MHYCHDNNENHPKPIVRSRKTGNNMVLELPSKEEILQILRSNKIKPIMNTMPNCSINQI